MGRNGLIVGLFVCAMIGSGIELMRDRLDRMDFQDHAARSLQPNKTEMQMEATVRQVAKATSVEIVSLRVEIGRRRLGSPRNRGTRNRGTELVPVKLSVTYRQNFFFLPRVYQFNKERLLKSSIRNPQPLQSH